MVSNTDNDRKYPAPDGYFRLLKLNAPEWPYAIMSAIGSILSGFIGPTFVIVNSNMIEVFYYRDPNAMERNTREFIFVYIGAGIYVVVAYLVQHYFFSIMGENLTTRVRRMMLAAILRNEVGWFNEKENNLSFVAACLSTDAADVKSAIAERISVILQNMTSLLTSFIMGGFIVEWRVALLILATSFPLLVLANFALPYQSFLTMVNILKIIIVNNIMKEVFTCAKDWGLEALTKELDCVKMIFHLSKDFDGKKLEKMIDDMLTKLGKKQISPIDAIVDNQLFKEQVI